MEATPGPRMTKGCPSSGRRKWPSAAQLTKIAGGLA
jgi:hypothetical protein